MKAELDPGGWSRKRMLLAIALIFLATRLAFLTVAPLVTDEGVYSIMIEEQIAHPTSAVTFLGYEVGWKPPLMFWTYGAFVQCLRGMPIPIEAVYRLPGTMFGLFNALLVFLLFEELLKDRKQAFFISVVYLTAFLPIHVDSRVLTDTMCGTFIFAGILAYMKSVQDRRWLAPGALMVFLAYFTKQTLAAIIPFLAIIYLFEKDRKRLSDPLLYASFLTLPLAMWLFDLSIVNIIPPGSAGLAVTQSVLQTYILDRLTLKSVFNSMLAFLPMMFIWFPMSIIGFARNWRRSMMMNAWYLLTLIPVFSAPMMPFYFYPVIPAMAYFSTEILQRDTDGKIKRDALFFFALVAMGMLSIALGGFFHYTIMEPAFGQKSAGEFLAGKENVLIIGPYSSPVFSYKMLEENRKTGKWLDYGLIIFNYSEADGGYDPGLYDLFIRDYHAQAGKIAEGNAVALFTDRESVFRKDTNLTRFDYICIVGTDPYNPGGTLVFNSTRARVFDMRENASAFSGGG